MATLTTIVNRLPIRDQLAIRLLGYAVQGGALSADHDDTVRRCYGLADAYLSVARESWQGRAGGAESDDGESEDASAP